MKILIIGSGGREHAIYQQCSKNNEVYMLGNNGAIKEQYLIKDVDGLNFGDVLALINKLAIELTIVGPEVYLQAGIVDFLTAHNKKVFGPSKYCANLEASKYFAKQIMQQVKIPTARYEYVNSAKKALMVCNDFGYPVVLKYDGLAAGKGVVIAQSESQAVEFINEIFEDNRFGNDGLVIEECLVGEEYSVFVMVNGTNYEILPVAQDYKRVFDNDKGPNTGGMGANTTSKFNSELPKIETQIIKPLLAHLTENNTPYAGFLYIGLMATNNGPQVIEFNVRMGDPETQVVMQKLDCDLVEIINNLLNNNPTNIKFNSQEYVGVVLASVGYPGDYIKRIDLNGLKSIADVYHMGTQIVDGNLISTGGRIAMVTASGDNVAQARLNAYKKLADFKHRDTFNRLDIALNKN